MIETLKNVCLSQRLKLETETEHERMHALMDQGQPFLNRERYGRFVSAQYLFQRDVEYLLRNPAVRRAVPDYDARGRELASLADLADLHLQVPEDRLASEGAALHAALGWLYVSEGSTLGAAFLFKDAQTRLGLTAEFGARNLAAYPEGRARAWRRFLAALDSDQLEPQTHDQVVAGARQAYCRFGNLLQRFFDIA